MVSPRDILGMNARNLKYIRPNNLRRAIKIADSKLKTKLILEAEKIPTPKLLGMFRRHKDIAKFNWDELPGNVVLKPNRGTGGDGIVVFSKKGLDEKGESIWITSGGEEWHLDDIERHILNILDGNFSLQNIPDVAFLEEKIITHRAFRKYTYKGLPDIRVIVYNKVPVMTMMRLPTKWSKGKANLAQGAIGAGIDMATGRTTSAAIKKPVRRFVTKHPDTAQDLSGLEVPYWNEVLEMAIRCQEISRVGFLGADIAVDEKKGPVILELNARPGLEIQNVNMAPLAGRLRRVEGLQVNTVEKGVRLAKEIFGGGSERKVDELISKPVIGVEETIEIISPEGNRHRVLARVDTGEGLSAIDTDLALKTGLTQDPSSKFTELEFSLSGEKVKSKALLVDRAKFKQPVMIGRRDLKPFIIDPAKQKGAAKRKKLDYHKIDEIIVDVNRKLPLLSFLHPKNLATERDKFFADKEYEPIFQYEKPSNSELDLLASRITKFKLEGDTSTIGKILYRKQQEIVKKVELIKSIGSSDFTKASIDLYGEPSDELGDYAEKHYRNKKPGHKNERFLSEKEILRTIKDKLEQSKITCKVILVDELPSRISVKTTGNRVLVNLRRQAKFRLSDLKGTLAHEIETHTYRHLNGALQPYKVFAEGLAGYLATEEGLAIYNKEQIYKNPRRFITRCLKVMAVNKALSSSFRDTYQYLRSLGVLPRTSFSITSRTKRGLSDTSRPGAFTREALYLKGFLEIQDYTSKGFGIKKLYVGKVSIKDLPEVQKVSDLKAPKYLPRLNQ